MDEETEKQRHLVSISKRLEYSLGRNMERLLKANSDAMWARLCEENAKQEKLLTDFISDYLNKEVPSQLDNIIVKEISSIGAAIIVAELFKNKSGEKEPNNEAEKSESSILEATMAVKKVLQDLPATEKSWRAMLEEIDGIFQKHTTGIQQQQDTINSASSSGQLGDHPNDLDEMTDDHTEELAKLISEDKFEEAFDAALHKSDVLIVSWLCSKVDLHSMLTTEPVPLSQRVLLSLLQQLFCCINQDPRNKLAWMTDVAAAINPTDPTISGHVKQILESVYQSVRHHRNLPTTPPSEAGAIRLLMHIIKSLLTSSK